MQALAHTESYQNPPTFSSGWKLNVLNLLILWKICIQDPSRSSCSILLQYEVQLELGPNMITIRHLNRLRVEWGLNHQRGRPRSSPFSEVQPEQKVEVSSNVLSLKLNVPNLGIRQSYESNDAHDKLRPSPCQEGVQKNAKMPKLRRRKYHKKWTYTQWKTTFFV